MNIKILTGFTLLFFAFTILFTAGCGEQKQEEPKTEEQKSETTEQPKAEEPTISEKPVIEEPIIKIPDLTGTWTGRFDNRSTTLKITEQDSTSFKGAITIQYREVINQQVSGTIDPEKKTISMKDLLHSRYAGSYSGTLSEDLNTFSGSFISNVDKNRFTFNLKRK